VSNFIVSCFLKFIQEKVKAKNTKKDNFIVCYTKLWKNKSEIKAFLKQNIKIYEIKAQSGQFPANVYKILYNTSIGASALFVFLSLPK